MILGLYTRVSTAVQVRGESLTEQDADGRAWAERCGHSVFRTYTDAGLSGRLPASERPGLAAALEALSAGLIDGLVIRDLDRLARELTVQEAVLGHIWSRPDTVVFEYASGREVLRDDPDDPMRTFVRQVMGAASELERGLIAKRLRNARRAKARRGGHASGPAPYGWRTRDGELFPVTAELETLDQMRGLLAAGLNQAAVAAELNCRGLRNRDGGPWSQQLVSRVSRREASRSSARRQYEAERMLATGAAAVPQ